MTPTLNLLKNKILERIASGKINMVPRWHFVLRLSITIALLVAFGSLAVFLLSFIFFILPANGSWFLHDFGAPGWLHFFRLFPWLLAVILAVSTILLAVVLERFRFAYHRPVIYLGLGTLLVVLAGGLLLAQTPMHRAFYQQSKKTPRSVVGDFYRGFGRMHSNNVYLGTVNNIASSTFQIETESGELLIIMMDERTNCPFGCDLEPNDTVMIMGNRLDGTINAFGVREIKDDEGFFGPPNWRERPPRPGPRKMMWP